MGVRARLILLIVGVTTIVMLAWGVTVVNGEAVMLRSDAQDRGLEVLRTLSVPCALALEQKDTVDLGRVLHSFQSTAGGLSHVNVFDANGNVVAQSVPDVVIGDPFIEKALAASDPMVEDTVDERGRRLRLSMPLTNGARLGTATAEVDLAYVERRIQVMKQRIVYGSALMSAFAALCLSVLVSTSVMRPLESFSQTALRVSRGDLSARVPDPARRDELGLLARVFNEMVTTLQGQTAKLESEVLRRTEELRAANGALGRVNEDLAQAVGKLELLASTDGLTGLANHRAFQETLTFELRRARRNDSPLSVLMIDVDHFKAYNDTNGHPAGDQVLAQLARILRESLRDTDVVARYGGEEFTVLLLDTGAAAANHVAQKLRDAVRAYPFPGAAESQPDGRVTISIGVASYPEHPDSRIVFAADQALYVAKSLGRDQVVSSRAS